MTAKGLLFCLFLYVSLVWVGAAYLYTGRRVIDQGLLWTAIGLMVVLASVILARVFIWWKARRARMAAAPPRPAPRPVAASAVPSEDEAMKMLVAEANAVLARAPALAAVAGSGVPPLSTVPLYLLIGPERSGKTSAFLNSGLEAQPLAGEGFSPAPPTRLANLWLASGAVFVELGGKVFAGDVSRWRQCLAALDSRTPLPGWRRLRGEPETRANLRGVIAFCDCKEFLDASGDPQRLERSSRDWQDRLRAIAERFGAAFPVYFVVSKCDQIPYFPDFFRRLPDSQSGQVLGCSLPPRDEPRPGEVFAEAESKRLSAAFRPLYHALARRRISLLSREAVPAQKGGIYEFPRELKRIRSPLVQFLTDVFRPYALGPSPVLRGYYLTGVREIEAGSADAPGVTADSGADVSAGATRLFHPGDATRIFQPAGAAVRSAPARRSATQWLFVADLLHKVVLGDSPLPKAARGRSPISRRWRLAMGAVCGLCGLLCVAFTVSWAQNRRLLSDVSAAMGRQAARQGRATTLADLQALEALRLQLLRLQDRTSLSYHWGLYSGNRVVERARNAYFRQFSALLLMDLNAAMVNDLNRLSPEPDPAAPYDPVYRTLKTHLMITSGACPVETALVSGQLKETRARIAPEATAEWRETADRQIDFYAVALARGNPLQLPEDVGARDRARLYLQQIKGIDQLYAVLRSNAERSSGKPKRLSDLVPNYTRVLTGSDEVNAAFSREGWAFVEKASREGGPAVLGDACVVGEARRTPEAGSQSSDVAQALQRLYLRDYVTAWQRFVEGFSVLPYNGAGDAATKLDVLSARNSPILGVLAMTAGNTNFPAPPGQAAPSATEKLLEPILPARKKSDTAVTPAPVAPGLNTPADISRYFQPVHWVEPPGSDTWAVDKANTYLDALTQLRQSMQQLAQAGRNPDPQLHTTAAQSYDKALETVRQIARGFKSVDLGGLDVSVERLLTQPIQRANPLIIRNMEAAGAERVNRQLRSFCASYGPASHKYPLQQSSNADLSLQEFAAIFAPDSGTVWKLQQDALADFVVKEQGLWKAKDPARKPQVTPEMLAFLNRAQLLANGFFVAGSPAPRLTYVLRPTDDKRLGDSKIELEVDGAPHVWTTSFQRRFNWPPPPGAADGATGRLRTSDVSFSFESWPGVWGVFRMFGDAELRELKAKIVEWRYTSSGRGRREPIKPAPVQLEIVEFPGGQDFFNPRWWQGLGCPVSAVQ